MYVNIIFILINFLFVSYLFYVGKLFNMSRETNKSSIDRVLDVVLNDMRISKAEFCRKIGVTTQTFNNWIKREKIPGDHLPKIAQVINKSVDWIYTGNMYDVGTFEHSHVVTEPTTSTTEEEKSFFESGWFIGFLIALELIIIVAAVLIVVTLVKKKKAE